MFVKKDGAVSLALELLDTEEENSDEPADAQVRVHATAVYFNPVFGLKIGPQVAGSFVSMLAELPCCHK